MTTRSNLVAIRDICGGSGATLPSSSERSALAARFLGVEIKRDFKAKTLCLTNTAMIEAHECQSLHQSTSAYISLHHEHAALLLLGIKPDEQDRLDIAPALFPGLQGGCVLLVDRSTDETAQTHRAKDLQHDLPIARYLHDLHCPWDAS